MKSFNDTFLTERQLEVYVRRLKGETLEKIARDLGTTKSNICAIEKSAKRNVERAYNTIKLLESLMYETVVEIHPETDIYDVPGVIYKKGDEMGIKISMSGPVLLKYLVDNCGGKLRGRKVVGKMRIAISRDGSVVIL
ncbi:MULTISPECIES: Tfx family DNA-binding protein [unclassified Archaeoglobus]|jgi:hypothetical protein|uniref:Tfx family DNA-binding protein n=1 Tax=unclassified Archaeoglobus TaxID=2643606 RepID=UPI0025BAE7ED|nr:MULTISPECIES: Tfx family DNA-binding protein [unclassified Archaeoglobus]